SFLGRVAPRCPAAAELGRAAWPRAEDPESRGPCRPEEGTVAPCQSATAAGTDPAVSGGSANPGLGSIAARPNAGTQVRRLRTSSPSLRGRPWSAEPAAAGDARER